MILDSDNGIARCRNCFSLFNQRRRHCTRIFGGSIGWHGQIDGFAACQGCQANRQANGKASRVQAVHMSSLLEGGLEVLHPLIRHQLEKLEEICKRLL